MTKRKTSTQLRAEALDSPYVQIVDTGTEGHIRREMMITPRCWRCRRQRVSMRLATFLKSACEGEYLGLCSQCRKELPIRLSRPEKA